MLLIILLTTAVQSLEGAAARTVARIQSTPGQAAQMFVETSAQLEKSNALSGSSGLCAGWLQPVPGCSNALGRVPCEQT